MSLTKYIVLFIVFNVLTQATSQTVPEKFKEDVTRLMSTRPQTYEGIKEVVSNRATDTVLMKYLLSESEEKGYLYGQIYAINHIGRRYRNLSEYAKAIKLHMKALDIANKTGNIEFKVFSLNMLSVAYRRTDAIKSALDYSQEALSLAESVKNPTKNIKTSINVSVNGIGNIYKALEQYDLAIKKFERSLKLEQELGNKYGLAINYQNIGECYENQNNFVKALENYNISLGYNEEIDSDMGRIICKNSIAQIYIKQDRVREALEILEPTLMTSEYQGDMAITSEVHINMGWAQMKLRRYRDARRYLMKGLDLANRYTLPRASSRAYRLLSQLSELQGRNTEALDFYKKSVKYSSEISNDRNVRYVTDMIFRYDAGKQNSQIQILAQENEMVKMELKQSRNILLVSGIALALLAGIFYILYRQFQLNNEKKLLTLEQSMLRSQMNPHFLFNSLNSIKLYIINNEQKNAVYYLNKFSKLVRKILEASSLKEIQLAEELETVELYMNIENIRFSEEINFKINIAEDVDTHTVKIPSLILQPFLENALWHGLSSKEGEKNITVDITRSPKKYINIAITDNGIGRKEAERIKKAKVLQRKSVGIDITKERLANFSRDYENTFKLDMIDLYDENKEPCGTTVILHIPTA